MHIAATREIQGGLLPALDGLAAALHDREREFAHIVKIGRTHAQDATPLTLGQEFSGYRAQVELGRERVAAATTSLYALAQGATAVGTGLNSHPEFSARFCAGVAAITGLPFAPARNLFEAIAAHDALVYSHGALSALAGGLFKIANDIRLLGSGPRCGLGELILPENEAGSSIMPGKVNPTQCEALTMACCRVIGNQTMVNMAGSQGQFELNAYKPALIHGVLQSVRLLTDSCLSFRKFCIEGLAADEPRIGELLGRSLMLVTALAPRIGYDQAAAIAKAAHRNGTSLREEALASGRVSMEDYDALVRPEFMISPTLRP